MKTVICHVRDEDRLNLNVLPNAEGDIRRAITESGVWAD